MGPAPNLVGARLPKDRERLTTDLAFLRYVVCWALARAEPCAACATSSKVGSLEEMSRSCRINLPLSYAGTGSARATVLHIMSIYKAGIRCRRCLDVREPRPTKFNAHWLLAIRAALAPLRQSSYYGTDHGACAGILHPLDCSR